MVWNDFFHFVVCFQHSKPDTFLTTPLSKLFLDLTEKWYLESTQQQFKNHCAKSKYCLAETNPRLAELSQTSEVGIYKRKQESKKTRKQELDQGSDQEKRKVFSFFLDGFFYFLDRFLGQVLVFIFS